VPVRERRFRDECTADGAFALGPNTTWPALHHFFDHGLARAIVEVVANGSILDIGAGSGQYGVFFESLRNSTARHRAAGPIPRYRGVDGMRNVEEFTRRLGPPGALTTFANICDPAVSLGVHDWVMSFEVGEHLPQSCLATYLRLLDSSNRRGIILSWSPMVSGQCHINARAPNLLIGTLRLMGYELDRGATVHGRHRAHLSWMRHNYLVLRKRSK